MKIPQKLIGKWRLLRSYGDNKLIVARNDGLIEMDVSRAFKKLECSDQVFKALADFYAEKGETVKAYL